MVDRLEGESNLICMSVVSLGLGLVFRKSSSFSVFAKFYHENYQQNWVYILTWEG